MSFTYQSSSFISYITTDVLSGSCNVHLKNGACYAYYSGSSRRALLNLKFNRCLSLGMWYNYNCLGGNTMREVPSTRKLWQSFA
jgi:hypothetical protein